MKESRQLETKVTTYFESNVFKHNNVVNYCNRYIVWWLVNGWVGNIAGVILTRKHLMSLEKTVSQCHLVYHISHVDCTQIDPRPWQWVASDLFLQEVFPSASCLVVKVDWPSVPSFWKQKYYFLNYLCIQFFYFEICFIILCLLDRASSWNKDKPTRYHLLYYFII